jgi:hypothetical protein
MHSSEPDPFPIVGRYCRVVEDVPRDGVGAVVAFCNEQRFIASADILSGFIARGNNVRVTEFYPPDFVFVTPLPKKVPCRVDS